MIGIGGILGANARYLVANWAAQRLGADFPYGTFIINVSGSFLLGFFMAFAAGSRLSSIPITVCFRHRLLWRLYNIFDLHL